MFNQAKADHICEQVAQGKTLLSICRQKDMPSYKVARDWKERNTDFRAMFARALADSADALADEIREIMVDPLLDSNEKRVRIDTLKWIASKRLPKVYGDRIQSDIDMQVTVTVVNPFQIAQDATILAADALLVLDAPE